MRSRRVAEEEKFRAVVRMNGGNFDMSSSEETSS